MKKNYLNYSYSDQQCSDHLELMRATIEKPIYDRETCDLMTILIKFDPYDLELISKAISRIASNQISDDIKDKFDAVLKRKGDNTVDKVYF